MAKGTCSIDGRELTVERLRELLDYDPDTGVFRWRRGGSRHHAGKVAGCVLARDYRRITINYTNYLAHRLAWLYVHGEWPADEIDHINGESGDNRIANLRVVTPSQNCQNIAPGHHRPNKTGFPGVNFHTMTGRWKAQIMVAGRSHYVGLYDTPEEASAAYVEAKRELHPFWVEATSNKET